MTTESEMKLERYNHVEKEADALGRIISVRRLKPSEQAKISGMTPDLSGFDDLVDKDTGEKIQISHRLPLFMAAAVSKIDDVHIPFPKRREELDAIYDRLDIEGMTAVGKALTRLNAAELEGMPSDAKEAAKN